MSATRRERRERKLLRHRRVEETHAWAPGELHEVAEARRLAYSRKQAAEALGVSISTIDRRVVPALQTVKTPWGQRLIPVAELERFLRKHLEPPRQPSDLGRPGRPRCYGPMSSSTSASTTPAGAG
jgi:hypothetical protein